jgi:hypothetical protein
MTLPAHYSADAREAWAEWIAWRKKKKFPCTERVERLALKNLAEYEMQGHKPEDVIDYSMLKGYRGLYPEQKRATTPFAASHAPVTMPERIERAVPHESFFSGIRKSLTGRRLQ